MLTPLLLLCSLLGLLLSLSFASASAQPDWSFAILLAALVSLRKSWFWVLPSIWFHDVIFYWSIWTSFPYFLLITVFLFYADKRLGPGQPQRWISLLVAYLSLFIAGLDVWSCLLTMMLTVWIWSLLSTRKERVYVEPA